MENQNSTEQAKKGFNLHGRKKKAVIIGIAVFLVFSFAARGIGFRGAMGWGNHGRGHRGSVLMGTGNVIGNAAGISAVAAKDFEPVGIVFAEAEASRRNGYGTIHDALVREAAQKGADAIINVSIAPTSGVINRTWSGSALAVKYLD